MFYVSTCKTILKKIRKSYLSIKQDDIIDNISNIYKTIANCIDILNDLICKLNILNLSPIETNYFHSKHIIEQTIDSYKDILCIFEEYMILLINRLL